MATRLAGLCVALALAAGASGFAAQDAKWQRAVAEYNKNSKSRNPEERATAVRVVGEETSDKTDRMAAQMILQVLGDEVMKDKGGNQEDKVSGVVLDACEAALKRIMNPKAVEDIATLAQKGRNARARFHAVRALGVHASQQKLLATLVEDPEPMIQMAAIDALAAPAQDKDGKVAAKDPALLDTFMKVLSEPQGKKAIDYGWEHKLAALAGIDALGIKVEDAAANNTVIDKLIVALAACLPHEAKVKIKIIGMLGTRLGIADPKSDDPNWWLAAKADKNAPLQAGQTSVEATEFFGLKTKTTRIIYVLDRTGSMEEKGCTFKEVERKDTPKNPPPPDPTPTSGGGGSKGPPNPKEKPDPAEEAAKLQCDALRKKIEDEINRQLSTNWTKMQGLKMELLRSIYNLDRRVFFTIVWFEVGTEYWKDHLVPATWVNKLDCFKNIDKMQPSGGTNVFGGIEAALKFIEHPGKPDSVEVQTKSNTSISFGGVDTLFVMTDGNHNNGKFLKNDGKVDPVAFVGEIKKIYAMRKVQINTVALGDEGVGPDPIDANTLKFLSDVAQATGGVFVHIGKAR